MPSTRTTSARFVSLPKADQMLFAGMLVQPGAFTVDPPRKPPLALVLFAMSATALLVAALF